MLCYVMLCYVMLCYVMLCMMYVCVCKSEKQGKNRVERCRGLGGAVQGDGHGHGHPPSISFLPDLHTLMALQKR